MYSVDFVFVRVCACVSISVCGLKVFSIIVVVRVCVYVCVTVC
jgi:hypothetical protein